ncbi:MAG TPA: alpha/beta fold hydrolase [Candidatus Eremiobacteraceae bacterium]|nr:alpha/beta fold hydrolase [Candidatus Eremiobacteraceae bacterium]
MRARLPDQKGDAYREGVRISYEIFGDGPHTIVLMPPWAINHSRTWKGQIPYLARHFRVVTYDAPGNGLSDRPQDPAQYTDWKRVADAIAVMDATETKSAVIVGICTEAWTAGLLAGEHPHRVDGLVFIAPVSPYGESMPEREATSFDDVLEKHEGWAKENRHYWLSNYRDFLEFFFSEALYEPHSTKQIEDTIGWGLETDPKTLIATVDAPEYLATLNPGDAALDEIYRKIECPVLVVHGENDRLVSPTRGVEVAKRIEGADLVVVEGGGHALWARQPVKMNLLLRGFGDRVFGSSTSAPSIAAGGNGSSHWRTAQSRRRRALYISSPIGLGHAQRDLAIARELRRLHPDLEIDWLAQDPVTRVLEAEGERIHPASRFLASESKHIEVESGEHDLHAFQALRRMDEILVNNFMVFHDIVRDAPYDVWIGDESWELDYYLHENPEEKRAAYVWMTDFVGWIPMPDGGDRERFLTSDYNAEMIGQIARYPRLRDRSIFVGTPDDIVPEAFGAGLPVIRDWTEKHYEFAGYVTGFDPSALGDRAVLRAELGYKPDETVCIVTVGGSGVGGSLLRKVIASFPAAKRLIPSLRMIAVAGPRIDPASLPAADGLEIRPYVHNLYRHLAVCDIAVVQGGLTTGMELVANKRPFLYFPLRHHFEQWFHVRHRLDRYGAGRCMDYETATPDVIAGAIANELKRKIDYRPVETDGAARAAASIAQLL